MKRINFILNKNHILKSKAFIEDCNMEAIYRLDEFIKNSEKLYTDQIKELVDDFSSDKYNKIMLLAGPSSAGKTTTSNLIRQELENRDIKSVSISLDDFFVDRAKTPLLPDGSFDFESIYALDLDYLAEFIDDILATGKAKMPLFDFLTGKRKTDLVDLEIDKNTILIIEGLHALNPLLIRGHEAEIYKIYICLNTDFYYKNKLILPAKKLRLMRRLLRDYYSRGHSVSATLGMWKNVLIGEDINIKPYKESSDYIVDSTHNYEPLLYANYLLPLLEQVENNKTAQELIGILKKCKKLDNDVVPEASLLWEFLVNKD